MSRLPVLVVGAGPVGQTTAALLARWGLDVRLFEQRESRERVGSRSICQARDVLDIWERVGVGHRLAAEGVTWTTARTFFRDQELGSWQFTDRGRSVFPPFVNIGQQRTEQLLDGALRRLGVTTAWGHELVRIEMDDVVVHAVFRGAFGETTVAGTHLVLATGARSELLRTQLGVQFAGETFADQFLICDVRVDRPDWASERRFYFDPSWNPGRQVLIHACPDSTFRIDWQVPDAYDLAADEQSGGLDRRIRAVVGDRPYEIVWKSLYRFQSRAADRLRVGRVLLAGDAGHLVSPFGARGLNTGVHDAENAAWKVLFDVHHWSGPDLLESYHAERHAATLENLEVTSATMRFLVPQDAEQRSERLGVLLAAAADPALAASVDSGRFSEPFWYVDSPLTTRDPSRPFAGRPPRGTTPNPAPGVLVPDLPVGVPGRPSVTRLRELLRDGFTVLLPEARHREKLLRVMETVTDCPAGVIVLNGIRGGHDVINTLGMRTTEAWLIRPDAYVAAIVPASDPEALAWALRRALGYPEWF